VRPPAPGLQGPRCAAAGRPPDGAGLLPGPRALGAGPGPGGRQWPAMQLQPNTNADKDVAVLLCGSRDWTDEDAVWAQLERAVARFGAERLVVIAGGARGADRQAEACARELGLAVELYPARLDRHGRSAGYVATSRCSTGSPTSRTAT
jgi:hypothetical protein